MVLVALLVGVLVAPIAAAVAYADATRLGQGARERLAWALAVGSGSFSGFLLAHRFDDALTRVYLHDVKAAPVLTSPYELLALHLTVGVAVSAASVVSYGVAVRFGRGGVGSTAS